LPRLNEDQERKLFQALEKGGNFKAIYLLNPGICNLFLLNIRVLCIKEYIKYYGMGSPYDKEFLFQVTNPKKTILQAILALWLEFRNRNMA